VAEDVKKETKAVFKQRREREYMG